MKRGVLQFVLAGLLLMAQQGALTHEAQHVRDPLPARTQQQDPVKKAAHSATCKFHISFAEVLGAVDCARPPLRLATNCAEPGANSRGHPFPAELIVPASRGPPVLL